MRYRCLLPVVVCLLWALRGEAQQILFRSYNVADGLPSSTVRAIAQDDQGYLWFGTKNGLGRFDGYGFKVFQATKNNAASLGNNFIHCITRYDSTTYWIGTEGGIFILDLETETFSSFQPLAGKTVFDILKDKKGKIWIASRLDGLFLFDPVRNSTENLRENNKENALLTNSVTKLACDDDGNIWIGTFGFGVAVFNPSAKTFTHLRSQNSNLSADVVNTVYKGNDGVMWIGTMNGGLCKWQKESKTFKVYKSGGAHTIRDNIVRALYQTSPDKLYVGTEKGLHVLHLATDKFVAYTHKSNDPYSISDNAVYSLLADKSGTLWVGTFFGGINYFGEKGSAFELYYPTGDASALAGRAVSSFLEDEPGKLWIGTEDGGLHLFDAVKKTFQRYPFLPKQQKLSYHNIHALVKDRKGRIWIGIFAGGVNVYHPATGKVRSFKGGGKDGLNGHNVFSIYEDRDGVIWVGTDKGLNRFNEETERFTSVMVDGVHNTMIYEVYEDGNKNLWVATYNNGLVWYNKKTGTWRRLTAGDVLHPLSSNKLVCLLDDGMGHLWIGTDGGGLNKYSLGTGANKVYDATDGLTGNVVYGLQKDDQGLLWMTTNNGIYSLDPQTEKFRHFTGQDNLQSQQFNYRAFYKTADGKMYAGGIKGFNAFYPEGSVATNPHLRISFTNFQLFNKNLALSADGSPLRKQINYTRQIELSHDQSVIGFEFAALHFSSPEKVRYAYKMEGFDAEWNRVGNQRKATYTNLAPGRYRFRVKGTTDENTWDIPEAVMHIVIRPPIYKTTGAYLLYAGLFLLIAYGIYRYSVNYIRKKNQVKLERLKNREEQAFYARKIEFFTVMAHEIRTPLSLIIAPLEKLLSLQKWDRDEKEQLQIMDENADRLLSLVNQLLDFRRIESDAYTIQKEEVEIVSLVQSVYSRFSSLPYQKDIAFTMSTNISQLNLQADPEVLNKILSNLLINAFKFARKQVTLSVHDGVKADGDASPLLCIHIEDDGIGIASTDLKNIFTKFFTTTAGNHQYHNLGGTGIGLSLASSLAELHGGRLLVESQQGSKTVFTLELPYTGEKAMVNEEHPAEETEGQGEEQPVLLLVEDDEAIRSFVAKSLRGEGYTVVSAANGTEALQVVDTTAIDLIIADVMMPEMDGFTFCRTVKTNINYSHIPLVFLTAKGNREAEIEGFETGADAYILKPFKWKHLVAVVKNLLLSREQLKEKYSKQPGSDITVLATNARDKAFMENIVQAIEARLIDPQLSVEELGRDLAMSRSNLHKKLKSLSGFAPNELIRLVRLKRAAKLLVTNEYSIAEIAYMTGFNSPSYFSKCFLQQFGQTPKAFAEKNKTINPEELNKLVSNSGG